MRYSQIYPNDSIAAGEDMVLAQAIRGKSLTAQLRDTFHQATAYVRTKTSAFKQAAKQDLADAGEFLADVTYALNKKIDRAIDHVTTYKRRYIFGAAGSALLSIGAAFWATQDDRTIPDDTITEEAAPVVDDPYADTAPSETAFAPHCALRMEQYMEQQQAIRDGRPPIVVLPRPTGC